MERLYYIELDGQQYGAYTLEQVRQFGVFADTPVMKDEATGWKPAIEYPELAEYVSSFASTATAAAPLDIFNVNYYYKETNQLYGPLSLLELVYLDIKENTQLGINSTENWYYAGEIYNLMDTLTRLSALEKEEFDAELQKIKAEQLLKIREIELSKQELEEVIKEQEKELLDLELKLNPQEDISKETLLKQISEFKERLLREDRHNFTKSYLSFSKELLDKVENYTHAAEQLTVFLSTLSNKTQKWLAVTKNDYRTKNEILSAIRNLTEQFYRQNPAPSPDCYEVAESNHAAWTNLQPQLHHFPASSFFVGKNVVDFTLFNELVSFTKYEYATLLDTKNIVAYYNTHTKRECFDFINTLAARLFMSSLPGKFFVTTIDAQEMEGISDLFKSLNKSVFIYSRENEIQQCLEKKTQYIENVIQNLLLYPVTNIGEYNQGKENPESYQLLIIKAFPAGLTPTSLSLLKQIMKNGQRAGVHVILLIDKDELTNSENIQKQFDGFGLDKFSQSLLHYDLTTERYPFSSLLNIQHFSFEKLNTSQIQDVVHYVNKSLELKPAEVVPFTNFLPAQANWWSKNSANLIEIPFGISEEKELVNLAITQQSGQNSAVVIGIPGSGKSVFLHSVISSAIVNYSPDELELYLMDFSGVEFNIYALNNLPHAKVIAPEAEREFGLIVLRGLEKAGSSRMELCRNSEVSNIVDLRAKKPDLKVPRMLVIIDEFQKLFEIENDSISREAQSIIHIIIKEFRKFGINLILATQKLSDINSSILPKDLVANRVVFQCSPSDIGLIGMNLVPQLHTGECIYNSESGVAFANKKVQTFFISQKEVDEHLKQVKVFGNLNNYTVKDTIIFRSNDLPEFRSPNITPVSQPDEVDIYFGQPIAISESDVCASLRQSSNDNILIIGGEEESVAQKIAVNATLSIMAAHTNNSAKLYFFNFMRPADPLYSMPSNYYADAKAFETVFASKTTEVIDALQNIKTEIDARKADENLEQQHIYLSFYAFQLAQMFKKGGRRGDDVSEAGQLLKYILNNGPLAGVFTILQVDNVPNLQQIDDVIVNFTHRVALQMGERDSVKIVGSDVASRLYVKNRQSSKYRCYYYNNRNRDLIKFKPYR
jgi:hypothetical protein